MFIFSQLPVRSYRPGPIWQPGRKGGFRRKEEEKPKASKHHSSIAPCQILRSGRMAKGIDSTVMEAKPIPANAAPKHHSIKAPQHQSMYLAIRRLQIAGRCWLPAAEGRPQHQSPKAPKHPVRSYVPGPVWKMAREKDSTVMEAKPIPLTRPQSTIASKHHSIKACISRSAGCKPQVAAGCWRLKADRSIKAPKPHSTKAISCLVPSDRISAENGRISGVPGPGISGRRSCRCMQR